MNLSMKSVRSDSKLLICSVCFSISFSSLVKLSVFCGVGILISVCTLCVFELFTFPCVACVQDTDGEVSFLGLCTCMVMSLGLSFGYLILCSVL